MLEGFRVAKYRFTLRLLEAVHLPKFKGALLRGALGYALKRVCWFGAESDLPCRTCVLHGPCPYAYLFETSSSKATGSQGADMPRPYTIEPPLDGKTDYQAGDTLTFAITLIGRAIGYLPYFFAAYVNAGQAGLGKAWGRCEPALVEAVSPLSGAAAPLFADGAWQPATADLSVTFPQLAAMAEALPAGGVTLSLATPLRLSLSRRTAGLAAAHDHDGIAAEPAFPILVDNLFKRIALLYRTHCGTVWSDNRDGLYEAAARVQAADDTHWVDWTRTSTRQGRDLDYGGLLGRVRYAGDLRPFLPFLLLGSLIHVGQKCDAGNGLYRLEWGQG
ncbi:MAG TPA: CRISPR system precrRNA processing endoribonuclease RAMP protein Cas6 [Anaerolineae bacterium]|nr:CRISPR system precrRNA processing endoribonuclease RAMP protein Cas6 [Anaerolineae bacterium]HOQ98811.1 CRISPR system precrRNA processing endoribonuclease RAMP protein Cas6 [Anaerolineae bacterium]HPL27505.1 CRISPR system precrRNA processing endoribonuclease RAMP protein Cas6 [Anaerolineae bacterium]